MRAWLPPGGHPSMKKRLDNPSCRETPRGFSWSPGPARYPPVLVDQPEGPQMKRVVRRSVCTGLLACAALASLASADELYRQNPINSLGGYSSQDARNPGGLGWFSEVQDNFTASGDWTINQVEFWGG